MSNLPPGVSGGAFREEIIMECVNRHTWTVPGMRELGALWLDPAVEDDGEWCPTCGWPDLNCDESPPIDPATIQIDYVLDDKGNPIEAGLWEMIQWAIRNEPDDMD